jgi:hypothetical protein
MRQPIEMISLNFELCCSPLVYALFRYRLCVVVEQINDVQIFPLKVGLLKILNNAE